MHKNKIARKKFAYYAKILIVMALALLIYGFLLNLGNNIKLFDPINDVTPINNDNNTHIDINRGGYEYTESGTNNNNNNSNNTNNQNPGTTNNTGNTNTNTNANTNTNTNTNTGNSGGNNSNSGNNNGGSNPTIIDSGNQPQPPTPTIEQTNNNLRNQIQGTYGVTILYGMETSSYSVGGLSTSPITNPNVINESLNNLNYALSQYPTGLFREIKSGGIPLTIVLINSYSETNVTGVTDSSYTNAIISIAVSHPFYESFYHESYHYIERYMMKRGVYYDSWDTLNPSGFIWNNIDNSLSYASTYSENSYFVNNYAQTSAEEDRASTFEYMMSSSKASCLNYGKPIWKKANTMSRYMEIVLNCANASSRENWEKWL